MLAAHPCCVSAIEVPPSVVKSLHATQKWLDTLLKKSPEEIEKLLGQPKTKKDWKFRDTAYPAWEYKLEEQKVIILVFFFQGKVLQTSVQQLSN